MPRQAREKSDNATYHIMLRGINRQQIFEEAEDCEKFIEILQHYQAVSEYKIYAYCLMGNHVHLLMEFCKEDIAQAMKRIATKYVYWYNTKYERNGQDRGRFSVLTKNSCPTAQIKCFLFRPYSSFCIPPRMISASTAFIFGGY